MKIPANISERYISSVEREAGHTAALSNLAAAQVAYGLAKRALEDAQYALQIVENNIEDTE